MAHVESSVEVDVPVREAYNQWTQFESFPQFMEGIEKVKQLNDTEIEWQGEIGGVERVWQARIVEQEPNKRIRWQSIDGPQNNGTVTFERLSGDRTRINLRLDYEPESFMEKVGDVTGIFNARVKGDMKNFKDFIESRGKAEGAWRGEVHAGQRTR